MKLISQMAAILLTLACINPAAASILTFEFEGVGRGSNHGAYVQGTLSFELPGITNSDGTHLMERYLNVAHLAGEVTGGLQDVSQFDQRDTSLLMLRFPQSGFMMAGNRYARAMFRMGPPPFSQDLATVSFTGGRLWLRNASDGFAPATYDLTSVKAAQLVTVPLPATFPMFLGVCLATAFYGRRRKRVG